MIKHILIASALVALTACQASVKAPVSVNGPVVITADTELVKEIAMATDIAPALPSGDFIFKGTAPVEAYGRMHDRSFTLRADFQELNGDLTAHAYAFMKETTDDINIIDDNFSCATWRCHGTFAEDRQSAELTYYNQTGTLAREKTAEPATH